MSAKRYPARLTVWITEEQLRWLQRAMPGQVSAWVRRRIDQAQADAERRGIIVGQRERA